MAISRQIIPYMFLALALGANIALWSQSAERHPKWANVPPAPVGLTAAAPFLGDKDMAYRSYAITLQSFGNETGQVQALKDYNYKNLAGWFFLEDSLDSRSNYVPYLAAYYYGASQDPSELGPLIEYLRVVGKNPLEDKWRYLAHGVFLANHRMKDKNLALSLAEDLSKTYKTGMPAWPLQMKAFIAMDMGDKDKAHYMMLQMLETEGPKMDQVERNFMINYICNQILSPVQSAKDPLCHSDDK